MMEITIRIAKFTFSLRIWCLAYNLDAIEIFGLDIWKWEILVYRTRNPSKYRTFCRIFLPLIHLDNVRQFNFPLGSYFNHMVTGRPVWTGKVLWRNIGGIPKRV